MKKATMKPWAPRSTDTQEERDLMTKAVIQEINRFGASFGDHTVYVGQDTLVYGTLGDDGTMHIYECKILAATIDAEEQQIEGEAYITGGGIVS